MCLGSPNLVGDATHDCKSGSQHRAHPLFPDCLSMNSAMWYVSLISKDYNSTRPHPDDVCKGICGCFLLYRWLDRKFEWRPYPIQVGKKVDTFTSQLWFHSRRDPHWLLSKCPDVHYRANLLRLFLWARVSSCPHLHHRDIPFACQRICRLLSSVSE